MLVDLLQPAARLGALVALSLACACSLNPQPLPPGETPDSSAGGNQAADATTGDSAGFGSGDAASKIDATEDALPAVPPDGGEAAADAQADSVADGSESDGPSDGGSEDGE